MTCPVLVFTKDRWLQSRSPTSTGRDVLELPYQVNGKTRFHLEAKEPDIAVTLCSSIWHKRAIST